VSIQRDYILRLVEALAQAIANAAGLRRKGAYQEARLELDRASGKLFGLDLGLVALLGPHAVAAQLGHPEKVARLADLLEERAEVDRADGRAAEAERWAGLAAGLRGLQPGR
jgi:hypothetical protein